MLKSSPVLLATLACALLAGCPPPIIGPPIIPPEVPLPPLVPDPLAASGPGSVTARLNVKTPSLALGPQAGLGGATLLGTSDLYLPLGIYPGTANRPTRQLQFDRERWLTADLATGQLVYETTFNGVPLGDYTLRRAWWTYTSYEDYYEFQRGPVFSLTEAAPAATQELDYTLLEGDLRVPGRILLGRGAGSQYLRIDHPVDGGTLMLTYNVPTAQAGADARLFFELRDVPPGGYAASSMSGYSELTLGDIPFEPHEGLVLNNGGWPSFQHWPRVPSDNMFFGFLQLTGAREWVGDLRLAARPAGADPASAPVAWLWISPGSPGWPGEIYGSAPWYTYYTEHQANWPPPGIGYGLTPLPMGSYDIYAELLGFAPGERLSILLAAGQALPPADKADPRIFRDDRSKGAPWWVALPLELNLTPAQATAFTPQ